MGTRTFQHSRGSIDENGARSLQQQRHATSSSMQNRLKLQRINTKKVIESLFEVITVCCPNVHVWWLVSLGMPRRVCILSSCHPIPSCGSLQNDHCKDAQWLLMHDSSLFGTLSVTAVGLHFRCSHCRRSLLLQQNEPFCFDLLFWVHFCRFMEFWDESNNFCFPRIFSLMTKRT